MRGEGGPFLHLRVRHQLTRRTPRRAAIGALRCRLITWRGTNPPPRPAVAGAQPLRGCGGMAFVHAPEESWRGGRGEAVPGAREAGGRMGCARAVSRRGGRRWDRHRPAPQETAPPGPRSARGRGGAVGAGGTPRRAERRLLPRRHSGTPRAFRSAPGQQRAALFPSSSPREAAAVARPLFSRSVPGAQPGTCCRRDGHREPGRCRSVGAERGPLPAPRLGSAYPPERL